MRKLSLCLIFLMKMLGVTPAYADTLTYGIVCQTEVAAQHLAMTYRDGGGTAVGEAQNKSIFEHDCTPTEPFTGKVFKRGFTACGKSGCFQVVGALMKWKNSPGHPFKVWTFVQTVRVEMYEAGFGLWILVLAVAVSLLFVGRNSKGEY